METDIETLHNSEMVFFQYPFLLHLSIFLKRNSTLHPWTSKCGITAHLAADPLSVFTASSHCSLTGACLWTAMIWVMMKVGAEGENNSLAVAATSDIPYCFNAWSPQWSFRLVSLGETNQLASGKFNCRPFFKGQREREREPFATKQISQSLKSFCSSRLLNLLSL